MLGLLKLDFRQYRKGKLYNFIYIAYLIVMLSFTKNIKNMPYIIMAIVFLKNIVVIQTSLQRDESNNWEIYRLTFPIRRKEVILSKYIVIYARLLLDLFLYTGLIFIMVNVGLDYLTYFKWIFLYSVIAIFMISIFIPVFYKTGFIKSSNINTILLFAISFLVYRYINVFGFDVSIKGTIYLLLLIFALISLVLSYSLSSYLYGRRDL